jgi:hypothetical protein
MTEHALSTPVATPAVRVRFPDAAARAGMYESLYLRAVDPERPRGIWVRYTVHKRPNQPPRGSLWCTFFDAERASPFQGKLTSDALSVPEGGWIAIGDDAELGPRGAEIEASGRCEGARWSLRCTATDAPMRHLPRGWMYRAPLPRTKPTSPAPAARFTGAIELDGAPSQAIDVSDWRGMIGHNWGSEHAERWIWLQGTCFEESADAWLDVVIGRIRIAGRATPWVANGVLALDGQRHRLGGLGARGLLVAETPGHCRLSLPGAGGLTVEAHVDALAGALAGWRYSDPDGAGHDVSNCSIASLKLTVNRPGRPARTLSTAHGAAYELGMREHDHGVPLAPFADG